MSDPTLEPFRFATADGLSIMLVSEVAGVAWEFVGHEVATRAVWGALVIVRHRSTETTRVRVDGIPLALAPEATYRVLAVPLGDAHASALVLRSDAIPAESMIRRPTARGSTRRTRAAATPDRASLTYVYRADGPAMDRTDMPDGLAGTLAAAIPVPVLPEWMADLYRAAWARQMVRPLPSTGSLAGLSISLDGAAWRDMVREVVIRAHVVSGASRTRPTPNGAGALTTVSTAGPLDALFQ